MSTTIDIAQEQQKLEEFLLFTNDFDDRKLQTQINESLGRKESITQLIKQTILERDRLYQEEIQAGIKLVDLDPAVLIAEIRKIWQHPKVKHIQLTTVSNEVIIWTNNIYCYNPEYNKIHFISNFMIKFKLSLKPQEPIYIPLSIQHLPDPHTDMPNIDHNGHICNCSAFRHALMSLYNLTQLSTFVFKALELPELPKSSNQLTPFPIIPVEQIPVELLPHNYPG